MCFPRLVAVTSALKVGRFPHTSIPDLRLARGTQDKLEVLKTTRAAPTTLILSIYGLTLRVVREVYGRHRPVIEARRPSYVFMCSLQKVLTGSAVAILQFSVRKVSVDWTELCNVTVPLRTCAVHAAATGWLRRLAACRRLHPLCRRSRHGEHRG